MQTAYQSLMNLSILDQPVGRNVFTNDSESLKFQNRKILAKFQKLKKSQIGI
jgi:hypothetical protein